jgi:hypothetical protein
MPSADQHRIKAESNRRFLDTISLDDFPDWVVVAAFYTAVHLVERLRAAGHGDSTSHEDRLAYVQAELPTIHTADHVLLNASLLARYQSRGDFFAQFQCLDVRDRIVGQFLAAIEAHVTAHFGSPPTAPASGS